MNEPNMKAICPECGGTSWEVRLFTQGLWTKCTSCGAVVCSTLDALVRAAAKVAARPASLTNEGKVPTGSWDVN